MSSSSCVDSRAASTNPLNDNPSTPLDARPFDNQEVAGLIPTGSDNIL